MGDVAKIFQKLGGGGGGGKAPQPSGYGPSNVWTVTFKKLVHKRVLVILKTYMEIIYFVVQVHYITN